MKNIGFPIPSNKNEKRRALIPSHLKSMYNGNYIYIEKGYGEVLGYLDLDYKYYGVNVVSREEVLKKDIICDLKVGKEEYIFTLKEGQIIFGWIQAVQNKYIKDIILNNKLTAISWENMFEGKRHCFYRNNEIAGEAAILHGFLYYGDSPRSTKVAILGKGNVAMGAYKILSKLGAEVSLYGRNMEALFRKEFTKYDVVVNTVSWDCKRKDHIIYESDLYKMKRGSMILDISCDKHGAIESSIPTNISDPVYEINGVLHYVVDHTPTLLFKEATREISKVVSSYLDILIKEKYNEVIRNATIIENGEILEKRLV